MMGLIDGNNNICWGYVQRCPQNTGVWQTDRRTDRQTDRHLATAYSALYASHGKKL